MLFVVVDVDVVVRVDGFLLIELSLWLYVFSKGQDQIMGLITGA